jgi:uncharacterized membrane protein
MSRIANQLALVFLFLALGVFLFGVGFVSIGPAKVDLSPLGLYLIPFWYFSKKASDGHFNNSSFLTYQRWIEKLLRPRALAVVAVIAVLYFFTLHVFKHWSFKTDGFDMAFVNHALFNVQTPKWLYCSVCQNNTYLAEHLSWTLLIPGLFFSWISSNELVFLLQALCVVMGCVIMIKTFIPKDRSALWAIVLLMFLSQMTLHRSLVWDFREDVLGFLFVGLMLVGLVRKNFVFFYLMFGLTLLTKEHTPLILMFLPGLLWFDPSLKLTHSQKIWHSLVILVVSSVYFILGMKWLIPMVSGSHTRSHPISLRYGEYGNSPIEILSNLLTTPRLWGKFFSTFLLSKDSLLYPILLLGPLGFWARKQWPWLLPILPGLGMNLLGNSTQKSLSFHYDLVFLPFLFAAFLKSVETEPTPTIDASSSLWSRKLLWVLIFGGSWPFASIKVPTPNDWNNVYFLKELPPFVSTAASMHTLAHLTHVRKIHELNITVSGETFLTNNQHPYGKGQLIPLDAQQLVLDRRVPEEESIYQSLLQKSNFAVIQRSPDERFVVMKETH